MNALAKAGVVLAGMTASRSLHSFPMQSVRRVHVALRACDAAGSLGEWRRIGQRFIPAFGFVACIFAARLFAGYGLQGICIFRLVFGIECPGFGITRSVLALSAGHVSNSWQIHPAGIVVVAYFLLLAVLALLETFKGIDLQAAARLRRSADRYFTVVLIAGWLCRIAVVHISGT